MKQHNRSPSFERQQGAVLVLCLIFLLVITLIATGGMENSIIGERMAGNLQDESLAFQAAETSLMEAEEWLGDQVLQPVTSNNGATLVWSTDGPDPDSDSIPWWQENNPAWWNTNAEQSASLSGLAAQPQYVIEELYTSFQGQSLTIGTGEITNSRVFHRITARGVGVTENTEVLLQTTFVRPYD